MSKLGAGIFRVCLRGLQSWIAHEAGTEREKGRQEDGLNGRGIAGKVGNQRRVVQEVDNGEFSAVEVAGGNKRRWSKRGEG
jgi:hypothetical protein